MGFEFKLMKKWWYETGPTEMATVDLVTTDEWGSTSPHHMTTNVITDPVINNFSNTYYIVGYWYQRPSGTDPRFYGCKVDYERPE